MQETEKQTIKNEVRKKLR